MLNCGKYTVMFSSIDLSAPLSLSIRVIIAVKSFVREPMRKAVFSSGAPLLGSADIKRRNESFFHINRDCNFLTRIINKTAPLGPYHGVIIDNTDHCTTWRVVFF